MAPKPVTLTFAGDSSSLEKTFKNVGKATDRLEDDFDATSKKAKSFGGAMDAAAGATDASEGKFMGAADLLDGLGGAFGLPTEGATNMMRSFGDLSGGFSALGPMIGKMGGSLSALATGPVGLVILGVGLLAAGIIALYKNSETFRDIVTQAFAAVKAVIGPVVDTIGNAIGWVVGLFSKGNDEVAKNTDLIKKRLEDQRALLDAQGEKWRAWKDSVTQSIQGILNPLQNAREQSKVGFDEINANLIDNTAFFEGWMKNLQELTNRGFGALARKMYELGPTAEKAVGEMVTKSDQQLTTMTHRFGMQGQAADRAFTGSFLSNEGLRAMGHAGTQYGVQFKRAFDTSLTGRVTIPIHRVGPAVPGLQHGGPALAGHPYVVGEAGPELFVPGRSGTVVPHGGGTTIINVSSLDPAAAAPLVVRALDEYESRNGARYARV